MTRPAKSLRDPSAGDQPAGDPSRDDPTLPDPVASAAEAAVLRVLREADAALTAGEVKKALLAGGVAKADVDKTWSGVQKRIKSHDQVLPEGSRYRWTAQPREFTAAEALELLAKGNVPASRRQKFLAIVQAAMTSVPPDAESAARRRQKEIDAARALAELAIEVEELTINEASARAMIHRVRARVKRTGLEPIERAGEQTTFDRKRHEPIGRPIGDGTSVIVVRPGYVWKAPTEDVLISRAVVQDRS